MASIEARLKRLELAIGGRRMYLRQANGREVLVPTLPVIDAYLWIMADTHDLDGTCRCPEGCDLPRPSLEPDLLQTLASIPTVASVPQAVRRVIRAAARLLDTSDGRPDVSGANPPEGEVVV